MLETSTVSAYFSVTYNSSMKLINTALPAIKQKEDEEGMDNVMMEVKDILK